MSNQKPSRTRNLGYAALAGAAGWASIFCIFASLGLGLFLDAQFEVRGVFTVGLLLLSVPVSLAIMVYIALGAVKSVRPQPTKQRQEPSHTEED